MIPNGRLSLERFLHLVVVVACVAAAVWLLGRLSAVLVPFILAVALDYIVDPWVDRVQKLVKDRVAAVLITLTALAVLAFAFLMLVVPMIGREAAHFADLAREQLPVLQRRMADTPWLQGMLAQLGAIDWHTYLTMENLSATVRKVLPGFWSGVGNVFGWLLGLIGVFTTVLYMVFLLVDEEHVKHKWIGYIPEVYRLRTVALVNDVKRALDTHFRGQLKIAAILSIVYIIGFTTIGLPLALLMGLLAGFLNLIPYFGLVSMVPVSFCAAILSLETGRGWGLIMVFVLLVYIAAQALEGLYLTPRIQGKNTGLRPVAILLSLSVWGTLLGFVGLLLALPITSVLIAYYKRFVIGESDALDASSPPPPTAPNPLGTS